MDLLTDLHRTLTQGPLALPDEAVSAWAERGQLVSVAGADNRQFEVQYQGHLLVVDYTGDPKVIFWLAADWLDRVEPHHAPDALAFEAEILDRERTDVHLMIQLTERVIVAPSPGGHTLTSVRVPDLRAETDVLLREIGLHAPPAPSITVPDPAD